MISFGFLPSFLFQEFHQMPSNTAQSSGEVPMQQRALPAAIDAIERAISNLESTMYTLQSQLHPVLDSPEPEPVSVGTAKAAVAPYQHAEQVSDVASRIRALTSLASDLSSRLHV
jgi:hypothetical protein